MADKLVTLQDENKTPIYPESRASVVKTSDGKTVEDALAEKQPSGNYATKEELSNYATTESLTQGLKGKADTTAIPTKLSQLTNDSNYLADAPSDGKQYGRKDGEWSVIEATGSETYFIPASVMSMTSETPSEDVLEALGGIAGFEKLVEAAKSKNIGVEYEIVTEQIPFPIKQRIPVMASVVADGEAEGIKATMITLNYAIFDIFTKYISQYAILFNREGDTVYFDKLEQKFPNLPNLDLKDEGPKIFYVRSNHIDVVDLTEVANRTWVRDSDVGSSAKEGDIWIQTKTTYE